MAELGEPSKTLVRCTKSQAVHLGPPSLCRLLWQGEKKKEHVPCGIDDGDLELIRADDASFYGQDSAGSDTDSDHRDSARCQTRRSRWLGFRRGFQQC